VWKELMMQRNADVKKLVVGNPEVAKKDLEDLIAKFNRRTKQMAENLKSGTLYDFLIQRVPKEQ
jgi:Flp pilus assembly secretin CpaC